MKKILVPVDFSACSENALRYGAEIARKLNAHLTVYHAYHFIPNTDPNYFSTTYLGDQMSQLEEVLTGQLKTMVAPYRTENYGAEGGVPLSIDTILQAGMVADDVRELVEKRHYDLVVLGTHGASRLNEIFGSITTAVADSVSCPVLVVPENATFKSISHILYAINFDEQDAQIIDEVLSFANTFHADVECLHINTDPAKENQERNEMHVLEETFTFTPFRRVNFGMVRGKSVSHALEQYADSHHIDLLAVLNQNRSFIDRLFRGSITRRLTYHCHIPLLILQKHKKKE